MLAEQYQRVNVNIARKELLALEYVSEHSRHYLYGPLSEQITVR